MAFKLELSPPPRGASRATCAWTRIPTRLRGRAHAFGLELEGHGGNESNKENLIDHRHFAN